ncbi:MAG: type II toxin-antitoxin system PemK/MazF family toxin [Betaproteobacteria bacterium]|nr:type II toxin-antitoxin system PemK/MazF family toxin [Betaproteobacteria bacterium]
MNALSGIFKRFDVVVVPFPFTDRLAAKRRPALVVSHAAFNRAAGHSVMAMITSAAHSSWPQDVSIRDFATAGLPKACVVRMKLFTLDQRLVLQAAGCLSKRDSDAVEKALAATFR